MKSCSKCAKAQPASAFPWRKDRQNRRAVCKQCVKSAQRAWRKARPDYEKIRYQQTKTETRERHLLRKYGIGLAQYQRLLRHQNNVCAICAGKESAQFKNVLHVDHCHASGKVRGLLCNGCNRMLGYAKDEPKTLRRAAAYLNFHNGQNL